MPSLTYEPPYRGLVPRFGMYAGPNYAGGRSWDENQRPDAAAWNVTPVNFLDAVTRDHDINYTYIAAAYANAPQELKNRALFESDKEMFLNVMSVRPAPGDFITAAYRSALIDAFVFKTQSGAFGYGLTAEMQAFWNEQIARIAPGTPLPNMGTVGLSWQAGKYVGTGMQDLATSGLSMQMQLLFNSHIADPAMLLNQPPSVGPDGGPPEAADYVNRLVIPTKTLLPDDGLGAKYLYTWNGTIDGKAVSLSYNDRTNTFVREVYSAGRPVERAEGSRAGGDGNYGQFDIDLTTTTYDINGQPTATTNSLLKAEPTIPLIRSDHFNSIVNRVINDSDIPAVNVNDADDPDMQWIKPARGTPQLAAPDEGQRLLAAMLPAELSDEEFGRLQNLSDRLESLGSEIPPHVIDAARELGRIAGTDGLRASLTGDLADRADVQALMLRIEQSGYLAQLDEVIRSSEAIGAIVSAVATRIADRLGVPAEMLLTGSAPTSNVHVSVQRLSDGSTLTVSGVTSSDAQTATLRDSNGRVLSWTETLPPDGATRTTRTFDGDGRLIREVLRTDLPTGGYELLTRNANGSGEKRIYDSEGAQVGAPVVTPSYAQTFASAISDATSLIDAIKSGKPLPQLASGLKLLNTLDREHALPYLGTASTVAQGVLSIYNVANAFKHGDTLDQISAAGNAVVAVDRVLEALEIPLPGLSVAAETIGPILQPLSLINSIRNGDALGTAHSLSTIFLGATNPFTIALSVVSLAKAMQSPPEAWGVGSFEFGQGTELELDAQGESFGVQRVASLMDAMKDYLDEVIESSQQSDPSHLLGIIPQRLGTLTWREARLGDAGYSLRDPDPVTGQESLDFLRYNDDLTPYNADPTVEAQRLNLLKRMVVSAIDREAIAPMWEVNTARLQQDIGDPNAGLTEEVRAARRGQLAPIDPATDAPTAGAFRPIALDLDGDGRITTVAEADNDRALNWDGAGFDKQVGWVGAGEGLLWLDRNPNGVVDSGKELFSNSAVADAAKGIRSLSWVDANADGVIDASDPVFAQLKVWQDADGDATADYDELQGLDALGITHLDYANARFTRNGQNYALQSQEIEASSDGTRVSVVPEGIRVEFSNGRTTVFVTNVLDLGAGNDGIEMLEDGGQDYDAEGRPIGQAAARNDSVSIAPALLLANDAVGGSNSGLAITAVGNASAGTVSINSQTGAIEYRAPHDYTGEATFDYTVSAPDGQTRTATVTVNVLPVNDRPTVSVSLGDREIYGWAPLVRRESFPGTGESGGYEEITITPDQGEPFYAPYSTVQGQRWEYAFSGSLGEYEWQPVGGPVDTGIPSSYYQRQWDARPTFSDDIGNTTRPDFVEFKWGGLTYRVGAAPATYARATPVATEQGNDGSVTVSDVDGNGGAGYRYEIYSDPLYGRLGGEGDADDIDPTTGAFAYTGERFVQNDLSGTLVNTNAFTDTHARGDEMFYDSFKVKVTDLSDDSYTIQTIEVPHYGPRPDPDVQSGGKKPIAIDLNGDGFHFTDVDDSNVFFDVNGDGWRRRIAWNNPQDGFLAYDKDGDRKISAFDELSFVPHDPSGQTDLEALRLAFDSNQDGVFSAADAKWNAFGVWQDADSDGVTDDGEFRSLGDLGISRIGLTADGQFQVIDGQTVHGTAMATRTDGSTLAVADVTLRYRNVTRIANPDGSTSEVPAPVVQAGQAFDGTAGPDLVLGTHGSDMFRTGDGNDVINDDLGNDGVQAGAGDDLVYTGVDNDVVDAGAGNDSVFAGEGNDLVFGDDGDDFLMLEGGNDVAFGGAGHDFIAGGAGNDALSGDAGDDKLFGEGGWDALFGKDGDDELWGMDGNDLLYGDAGNDLLVGGAGDDTMEGGAGNDTYDVNSMADTIIEQADGGTDTVRASIAYTLAETLENLTLTGAASIDGTGNAGDNVLVGNDAANRLAGLAGNDVIDGGLGADVMVGGSGDDTYVVDDAGDATVELAGEGVDTVRSRISHALADNVENLELIGIAAIDGAGNALDNHLTGNASANTLDGGAGADTMAGGRGNDRYLVDNAMDVVVEGAGEGYDTAVANIAGTYTLSANVEALELGAAAANGVGNELDNAILGNAGDNLLDGGAGADLLAGGQGDDGYRVDDGGDLVHELSGQGFDRVVASLDYVLPQHVEQLTLTGAALRATGNDLDNLLFGNEQANILDGRVGADQMSGGEGDDRYGVDDAGDVIIESSDAGIDTVVSTVSYGLSANVENLVLSGGGNLSADGNELANVLVGNAGANAIRADAGNDVLAGGLGDDELDGGSGDDLYLYHQGEGRDLIRDASGTDTLRFGAGITLGSVAARTIQVGGENRLFVSILGTDGQETEQGVEIALLAGGASPIESVQFADGSSVAFGQLVVAARTLVGGNGNDTLTGDRRDDTVNAGNGNDTVYGRSGHDTLDGGNGADTLFGEGGNDRLYGGNDADALWGGAGADLLDGGNGADTLVGGTGNDRLLGGNDADLLDGGDGDDVLDGYNGSDRLYAGAGNDTLDGGNDWDLLAAGAGNDVIVSGNGQDVIVAGDGDDGIDAGNDSDFVDAGGGIDIIAAGNGADFIAGGRGNDTIDAGMDQDVLAFNRGDGADVVLTSNWQRDTLSLGGGVRYADLSLRKAGNDLVLDLGAGDSLTFKDWYLDATRRNVTTLQMVTAAPGGDYDAASADRMRNRKAVAFDFERLANRFDQVRAANPSLTSWPVAGELDAFWQRGSDTQVLGGNLAWRYALTGGWGDLDGSGVRAQLDGFSATAWKNWTASTAVDPWTALRAGTSLLADATAGLPSPITPTPAPTADELAFAAFNAGGRTPAWMGNAPVPLVP